MKNPCSDVHICSACGGLVLDSEFDRYEPETGVAWCGSDACYAKKMYVDAWLHIAQTYCKKVKISA